MTFGRVLFLLLLCSTTIISCKEDENKNLIGGDLGLRLLFEHSYAGAIEAVFEQPDTEEQLQALKVFIAPLDYSDESQTRKPADVVIEEQLRRYYDPKGNIYTGTIPIVIRYRTEICKSIKLSLFDKNDTFLFDITDEARFSDKCFIYREFPICFLFNSQKKLLGKIENGMTINEYLSYDPLIFTETHFVFPGLDKTIFEGNYVKIEIEFEEGKILTTKCGNNP